MKIIHVCLCGPVTDGWSYQDNLLPKYHKKMGHETTLITSQYIWNNDGKLIKSNKKDFINEDGVRIIRVRNKYCTTINSKIKIYESILDTLKSINPDIIFIHGVQFVGIREIVRFLKKNESVEVYVDNHADFSNSASNFISKNILHKILWKKMAQRVYPYTKKFYGVLPARVDFLHEIYGIPSEKIEYLPMGLDDEELIRVSDDKLTKSLRRKYGIEDTDFLIVTGGKIDHSKRQTIGLMKAIKNIRRSDVKLLIFGPIDEFLKQEVERLVDEQKIINVGGIPSRETYQYLMMSDLVIFPGRHSVMWEQVVGLGKPLIVKYWEGTTHIDIGGNCKFLYGDSEQEIESFINNLLDDKNEYLQMLSRAQSEGKNKFLYSNIARQSIVE